MIRKYVAGGLRDISATIPPWENPAPVWKSQSGAYSIVKCDTQWDYQLETYYLAHCLGTKDYNAFSRAHMVYSLRDELGIPHATILCVRPDEYSPYGMSWDIGSYHTFDPEPGEQALRILQVRGRQDDLAMECYHSIVRDWYTQFGGEVPKRVIPKIVAFCALHGDSDVNYHFRYLLDEQKNAFEWAHWNGRMRLAALLEGTSL